MKLEIGQEVFCVYGYCGKFSSSERTIIKIGRKWAYLDGYRKERFNIETGWIDEGQYSSPGRIYISREDYEKEISLAQAWQKLYYNLNHCSQPQSITHEKIAKVRELLELPEPKED